jgi:SAM-dependent methyltransferase
MTVDTLPPAPLSTFLSYCSGSALARTVLDCGAGGDCPPLCWFERHGFTTRGVELSPAQLERARRFSRSQGADLGIILADMRRLPFRAASFSFVYSWNSICHMSKRDVARAMAEIVRVLRPEGLCFVNFLSVDDGRFGEGPCLGPGEYGFAEGDGDGLHSFFDDGEPDPFFAGLRVLRRERTRVESLRESGGTTVWGELHYIARKARARPRSARQGQAGADR